MSWRRDERVYVIAFCSALAHEALRDVDPTSWRYVSIPSQVHGVGPGDRFLVLGAPVDLVDCQRTTASYLREVSHAREITLLDMPPVPIEEAS